MALFLMSNEQNKEEKEVVVGTIEEALPNTLFKARLENGEEILTYLSGKMRKFRIKVLVGDTVHLEIDPYGGKARIIKRL